MTWTKLGDEFPDTAASLSDAAFRTHVEALAWSNRRLLDLVIPRRDLKRFAETSSSDSAVRELIDTGWWQDIGEQGWFIGCRFPEWQRDRVQVEHRREQEALRQRRKRRHDLDDHELCLPSSKCRGGAPSLSRRDIASDIAGDSRRDPGRDGYGTGRAGTGNRGGGEDERVTVRPSLSSSAADSRWSTDYDR